jgi:hypothetical protein
MNAHRNPHNGPLFCPRIGFTHGRCLSVLLISSSLALTRICHPRHHLNRLSESIHTLSRLALTSKTPQRAGVETHIAASTHSNSLLRGFSTSVKCLVPIEISHPATEATWWAIERPTAKYRRQRSVVARQIGWPKTARLRTCVNVLGVRFNDSAGSYRKPSLWASTIPNERDRRVAKRTRLRAMGCYRGRS